MTVDCQACGASLVVPPGVAEGREFACERCELLIANVEAARRFRWADLDPYVRAHGASRWNFWGGLAGAAAWVPALAIALAVAGRFDASLVAALGLPYLGMLLVLARMRARAPAARWLSWLWIGLGAYLVYAGMLLRSVPRWAAAVSAGSGPTLVPWGFGAVALVVGVAGELLYRRRFARAPKARAVVRGNGSPRP